MARPFHWRHLAWLLSMLSTLAAQAVQAFPAVDALAGRAPVRQSESLRCTDDGRDCVRLDHYAADVCKLIERNAAERDLDPNFLARLLWKESRFEPGAFGNIGLAAVAYNGGENRAARFIARSGGLPYETQDYVASITGFEALRWRDNPPPEAELKLALDPDMAFRPACEKLAGDRKLREFMIQPKVFPWGVIVASHPSQSGAISQVARLNRSLRPILGDKQVGYVRKRLTGMPRAVYTAQVGWDSRREAAAFCNRFKQLGGRCIVLRN